MTTTTSPACTVRSMSRQHVERAEVLVHPRELHQRAFGLRCRHAHLPCAVHGRGAVDRGQLPWVNFELPQVNFEVLALDSEAQKAQQEVAALVCTAI